MIPAHVIRNGRGFLLGVSLTLLAACADEGAPPVRAEGPPPTLDVAALADYVRPTDAHPAVLVNLWASW